MWAERTLLDILATNLRLSCPGGGHADDDDVQPQRDLVLRVSP